MVEPFEFTEVQAVDILDMQLRQLTRLSRIDLETEVEDIRVQIAGLEAILADDVMLRQVIKDELLAIRDGFATDRVCEITYDEGEMSIEDLVDDKELVIVMTDAQYVKAVPATSFKSQGHGGRGVSGGKLKVDDIVRHVIFTTAHAHLLFFSNRGKVYRLRALDIPSTTARPRACRSSTSCRCRPTSGSRRSSIHAGSPVTESSTRPSKAPSRRPPSTTYDSSRRDGLIAINLKDGDELVRVIETGGGDDIFMVSKGGMTIRFNEDDIHAMGRSAAGVRGMKLKSTDRRGGVVRPRP